jgi:hypothetical protein
VSPSSESKELPFLKGFEEYGPICIGLYSFSEGIEWVRWAEELIDSKYKQHILEYVIFSTDFISEDSDNKFNAFVRFDLWQVVLKRIDPSTIIAYVVSNDLPSNEVVKIINNQNGKIVKAATEFLKNEINPKPRNRSTNHSAPIPFQLVPKPSIKSYLSRSIYLHHSPTPPCGSNQSIK